MKHLIALTIGLYCGGCLFAQTVPPNPKLEFELKLPEVRKKDSAHRIQRVGNSLYDHIDFLDSRPRPLIGPAYKGLLHNTPADLVLKQPVDAQLTAILDGLVDSTAGRGELLFQLRRFYYIEEFATQFCFLQATIYDKTAGQYQKLLTLDTAFLIRAGDVMDYMKAYARPLVSSFIRTALTLRPTDSTGYDLYALSKMDSIERQRLPLFTDTAWVDGLYLDYHSFSQQLPDRQCMVTTNKSGEIRNVKVLDASGKAVEQRGGRDLYAVIYKGQAYIATEYGYYPVQRTDNELLFTGDIRVPASEGDLNGAQYALGLLGRFMASKGYRTTYTMAIDPLNGEFLHLRVIPQKPLN